jgi:hypothetical protein
MKSIKINILATVIFGAMITFSSCKKNDTTTTPPPANGTLLFHLHTDADTNEVTYDTVYVMTGGRRIVVTKAQLYLSNIQIQQSTGTWIAGPNINVLKVTETEPYTIGSVASGNYESVKYNVGLSAGTNGAVPSSSDPTLYRKDMWFDSTNFLGGGGFVFVDFEGSIDTATNPSAANPLIPFVYRIGTNANLRTVTMPVQNFTVSPNPPHEVHMIIDYAKLFTGVQLNILSNLSIKTAADNSLPLATQIANNIPNLVHYEPM